MAGRWVKPSAARWLGGLLVGVTAVAAVSGVIALVDPHAPALSLLVLYILPVLAVAVVWGPGLAVVTSVLSTAVFAYLFAPPLRSIRAAETSDLTALGVFLVSAVVVGQLAARSRRQALGSVRLSDEQSALRRVATLVAQAVPPAEVFEAVTREVGLLSGADLARMERFEDDGTVTGVAAWGRVPVELAVGTRFSLDGPSIARGVQQTGAAVRVDSFGQDAGAIAREARAVGIRASVGCPIVVGGRLWGVIAASTRREEPFPPDTETKIAEFTELVATAIANAQARQELQTLADEQAALRRVATRVAEGEQPEAVFAAVAEEVGQLLRADLTLIGRYDSYGQVTRLGAWSPGGDHAIVGTRISLGGRNVMTLVFETGRPARLDSGAEVSGAVAAEAHDRRLSASVGVPITVAGRLWGVMIASSTRDNELPAGTDQRLADFTDLVATAIANAEAHTELTASRARIVATADQTRRRIERDLHDGAQQRLVSLALRLRGAATAIPPELIDLHGELAGVGAELEAVQGDLRELSRGIHPAVLSEGGLNPALRALARRSPVPVQLQVQLGTEARLPEPVEVTAYYVTAEALTNVAKHAGASLIQIDVDTKDGVVRLGIRDDGVGGADQTRGSGLIGLRDRVEAIRGTLQVDSRPGQGTSLQVKLPVDAGQSPRSAL